VSPPIITAQLDKFQYSNGREVVKVLVPSSRTKPHQCVPHHVYYERIDDDFREMSHAAVDLHFRARHFRELNAFPLIFMAPDSSHASLGKQVNLHLKNLGDSPALNASVWIGGHKLSQRAILGPQDSWQLTTNSSDPDKDTWRESVLAVKVKPSAELEIRFQDFAGSRYIVRARATHEQDGREEFVRVARDLSIERDGISLLAP
jgi:hypothetical protein